MSDLLADYESNGVQPNFCYTGVVVDNKDPKERGRCRVRIEKMNDETPDAHLPWAKNELSTHSQGATNSSGAFTVPKIGAKVNVQFREKDLYTPVMLNYDVTEDTILPEAKEDYPETHIHYYYDTHTKSYYNVFKRILFWFNNRDVKAKNDRDIDLNNGRNITIKNGEIVSITTGQKLELICGKSSITLYPDRIVLRTPKFEGLKAKD